MDLHIFQLTHQSDPNAAQEELRLCLSSVSTTGRAAPCYIALLIGATDNATMSEDGARLGKWPNDPDIRPSPAVESPASITGAFNAGSERSRAGRQSQSKSESKNFEFVLVTDNESRRQVRRHAMRQYMHQRRIDSITRLGVTRAPATDWIARPISNQPRPQPAGATTYDNQDDVFGKKKRNSPPTAEEHLTDVEGKTPPRQLLPKTEKVKRESTSPLLAPKLRYTQPQAVPDHGAGRDPFNSYPIPIKGADHELIQHCN